MVDSQTMHDLGFVGVPVILILAGQFFNNKGLSDLKADMVGRFDRVEARLDRIDADLRQFYHLSGKLEGRIDSLEKRN